MDYKKTAASIIEKIGGTSNVAHLEHCSTRLRFTLKDNSKADVSALKRIDGVIGVVMSAQCQVIIGNEVVEVFDEVRKQGNFETQSSGKDKSTSGVKQKPGAVIMDFIVSVFQPLVPAMAGSGILKSLLLVLAMFGLIDKSGTTYNALASIADGVIYFLPMMIAVTVATKLGTNKIVALGAVGTLLLPNMTALISAEGGLQLFGMTVQNISYNSQIFPALLCVLFLGLMEKAFTKISPKPIRIFFVPMMSLLVTVPVTLLFLGPVGYNLGVIFTNVILTAYDYLGWIAIMLLAISLPFVISIGMHKALVPYVVNQIGSVGFDALYLPASLAHNIAESGACFGAALRTKDEKLRSTAISAGISALFGITEPALYGLTIQNKRVLMSVLTGCGIGGAFIGLSAIKAFAPVGPGLASMSMYVDAANPKNIIFAVAGFALSFAVSFIAALVFFKNEQQDLEVKNEVSASQNTIVSPLQGELIELKQVKDEVFSTGVVGEGVAIIPSVGEVYAPTDGVIHSIFPTKHAITFASDNGIEFLIHVGLDTVQLQGQHYETKVKAGDRVKAGDLLMKFDIDAIKKAGYDTTTPVILANGHEFKKEYVDVTRVKKGTPIIHLQQ